MRIARALILLLLMALPAQAERVVAGLSQARVSITTDFSGSEILVFGAVKREAPAPEGPDLNVVVTVAGPSEPTTVRRKDRRAGIWVNADMQDIGPAPTFYSVATSAPLSEILSPETDRKHRISIRRAIRGVGVTDNNYIDALIRIREDEGLYQINDSAVTLQQDTLFRAGIALPSNLTEGAYATRIFLLRGGDVIDRYDTVIVVRKVGLERALYNLAYDQPLIYGILSLAIAIIAGWAASAVFRYFQP
jgi:uncharacterized protein (TIGR02186 family)